MVNKHFDFYNSGDNIVPALKQMLEFIGTNLPANARNEKMLFKARVILTELITNSLKHSGSSNTSMHIAIKGTDIVIIKTDVGKPLSLVNNKTEGKVPITNDILHTLYAVTEATNQLYFVCEENKMEDILVIDDIVEHFGLLIITKASDNFTYNYDHTTKCNIFKVILTIE